MSRTIPEHEPASFVAGDTVKWLKTLSGYAPADGWQLEYAFVRDGEQHQVAALATDDGRYQVIVPAAASNWTPGIWYWQAYARHGEERYRVDEGRIEVRPNFLDATSGLDARSHVRKVLDALEAMLQGKASKDQASYTIAGRSLERLTPEELIKWHSHYKRLYQQELAAERAAHGYGNGGQIKVRFTR